MSKSTSKDQTGKVYLVGAGPGDLGLVTLRAKECIERADVIVYDHLANPELGAGEDRNYLCRQKSGRARVKSGGNQQAAH